MESIYAVGGLFAGVLLDGVSATQPERNSAMSIYKRIILFNYLHPTKDRTRHPPSDNEYK
jgi:hypothetical protein